MWAIYNHWCQSLGCQFLYVVNIQSLISPKTEVWQLSCFVISAELKKMMKEFTAGHAKMKQQNYWLKNYEWNEIVKLKKIWIDVGCILSCICLIQVKFDFKLKFLTLFNSQFPLSLRARIKIMIGQEMRGEVLLVYWCY